MQPVFSFRKPKVEIAKKPVQEESSPEPVETFGSVTEQRRELYAGASFLYASMKNLNELEESKRCPSIIHEIINTTKIIQALPNLVRSRTIELPDLMNAIMPSNQMDATYLKMAGFPKDSIETVTHFFNGFIEKKQDARTSAINTGKLVIELTFDFADEKLRKDTYLYIFRSAFKSLIKEQAELGENPRQRGYREQYSMLKAEWDIAKGTMDALSANEKSSEVKAALDLMYRKYHLQLENGAREIDAKKHANNEVN